MLRGCWSFYAQRHAVVADVQGRLKEAAIRAAAQVAPQQRVPQRGVAASSLGPPASSRSPPLLSTSPGASLVYSRVLQGTLTVFQGVSDKVLSHPAAVCSTTRGTRVHLPQCVFMRGLSATKHCRRDSG